MKFVIGSLNEAKIQAAKNIIAEYAPHATLCQMSSDSGVAAQPIGDEETLAGACNRALAVQRMYPKAIGIGLEGGVRKVGDTSYICNWGAFALPDGRLIKAGGAQIPLPEDIAQDIDSGQELGPVIDRYFKQNDLRQKEGAMGMFTAGVITRIDLFTHILQLLVGQLNYYDEKKNGA